VPFRLLLHLTVLPLPTLSGSHAKGCHRSAALGVAKLGISAQIADYNYFINHCSPAGKSAARGTGKLFGAIFFRGNDKPIARLLQNLLQGIFLRGAGSQGAGQRRLI
jgi:hypothetical protein